MVRKTKKAIAQLRAVQLGLNDCISKTMTEQKITQMCDQFEKTGRRPAKQIKIEDKDRKQQTAKSHKPKCANGVEKRIRNRAVQLGISVTNVGVDTLLSLIQDHLARNPTSAAAPPHSSTATSQPPTKSLATSDSVVSSSEAAARLRNISQLLRDNLITQAEHDAKRVKIMKML
jgi:hypothetical protein